ncbi:hypothetical protein MTY66_13110 [Mycolicibacterium sp. TY66]|uniref:pyridoxamine 5'-phosphate oxidase family protein n=1 Tax=unclassified Mycolicibacterium TaxID=2636767 RepID=UPI001BB2FA31|nr:MULTISPECIES: pyridoxamine 5'-phosphate oxidase family protein [unclassified Mycolicibacterium]BCI79686.1 hypothetical protein MTY66_13110 [Mycolicibacterium sp. TY66]BCJ82649.1 hypothetical protein MTY81_40220 [Mycolicibacterium sp. TY81]
MSVKVDLEKLGDTLADFPFGFLITVGDDFRPHTVAVVPAFDGGAVTIEPVGNTTQRNIGAHPAVTVLWPPKEPTGYSLIVDGTAEATDTGLRVVPTRAVLHRSPEGVHDCVSLKET